MNNTYDKQEVIRLIYMGFNACDISEITGCSKDYVYNVVRRNRVPYHKRSGPKRGLSRTEIFKLFDAGYDYGQIAEKMRCGRRTVGNIMGERRGMKREDNAEMYKDRIIELHSKGIGMVRISTMLVIPYTWVLQIASKYGLKESNKGAKKLIDREKIVQLYKEGYGNADIAKLMFCSKDSVTRILRAEGIETCERRKSKVTKDQIIQEAMKYF